MKKKEKSYHFTHPAQESNSFHPSQLIGENGDLRKNRVKEMEAKNKIRKIRNNLKKLN